MKNILITLLLLFTITIEAQLKQTLKEFEWVRVTQNDSVVNDYKSITRIFFNYQDKSQKIRIYINQDFYDLFQLNDTVTGKTDNGVEYKWFDLRDEEDGIVFLQYFEKENIARIFLKENLTIQLE